MRKIKFRGRDFYTNEWCYGGGVQIAHTDTTYIVSDSDGSSGNYRHFRRVKPETIQQLVKFDKKGKEVYAGNLVIDDGGEEFIAVLVPMMIDSKGRYFRMTDELVLKEKENGGRAYQNAS